MATAQRTEFDRTVRWKDGVAVWVIKQLRPLDGRFTEYATVEQTTIRYTDERGGRCAITITRDESQPPANCAVSDDGCDPVAVDAMLKAVAMAARGWEL